MSMELGPYTNFHELNLDWFMNEFNKVLAEWAAMNKRFSDLNAAFNDLRNYVHDYFNNLDVQEEIDNKLDSMAKDGSLYAIIRKYTDPIVNGQDAKIKVLENRMNTFASLPEGSTSGDAELIDIRVPASGFNGNTPYPSAGDAVRGQISDIKSDLDDINDFVKNDLLYSYINILKSVDFTTGKNYRYDSNLTIDNADFGIYAPVAIKAGETYYFRGFFGYFSTIYYDDETRYILDSEFRTSVGSFTAHTDGLLYITTDKYGTESILSLTEDMVNSDIRENLYINKNIKLLSKEDNLISGSPYWTDSWKNFQYWKDDGEFNGYSVKSRTGTWNGLYKYINVESGKKYTFSAWVKVSSKSDLQIALTRTISGEESTASVSIQNKTFEGSIIVPNKWVQIAVTFECTVSGTIAPTIQLISSAKLSVAHFELYEGNPYNHGIKKEYHVEKDGSGDFTRLVDAIEYGVMFMDTTVYVGKGTWDIVDELGENRLNHIESYNEGLYLKNRIHVIFSSDSKITCNYTGTRINTMLNLSAFNSGEYGFTLENARIESSKCRYCVHDERETFGDQYTNRFINCSMYIDNSENTGSNAHQCIGGGLGTNGHIIIEGGDYECINTMHTPSVYSPISYHNSWGSGQCRIDISNVYCKNGTIRLNHYGPSTKETECYVNGCSLTHEVLNYRETTDGTSPNLNMKVYSWNNEIRTN